MMVAIFAANVTQRLMDHGMFTDAPPGQLARGPLSENQNHEQRVAHVAHTKEGAQRELFRLLVANVRDYAIIMLDPTGHITTWNIGATRIKGYTADEIIGRHVSLFYPEEDARAGRCDHALERAARDGRFELEGWRVRKDGSRFWADVVITAIHDTDGTLIGFAKITRDLTERKRSDDERAARLAAEQSNRIKDEFFATLGHELRNPLAPIVTALQLAKLHPDTHPTRELQVIERQVQQLTHLVDDLLDVSRIGQGKLDLRRQIIDLRDSIARAIEIATPLMKQNEQHFELELPPHALPVDGDAPRLTQVFTNLLCNAAKYTYHGGHITAWVWQDGDHIVVEIRDDGHGMEQELLAKIFEPFVQGPQRSDQASAGLGLGLPLVRFLVEAHGGKVEARSPGPRRGSTFTVTVPVAPGDAAAEHDSTLAATFRSTTPQRCRILLVDDNDDARMLLADILGELGHEVTAAADGPEALAAVGAWRPDVAILDIGLPGMDGYQLAVELRGVLPDAGLIALSGYGQAADRTRSRSAGFDRHLVKPVEVPRLLQTIAEVTG